MRIAVVGTGFVGLTHAAVCSEYGHEVVAYDTDAAKIEDFKSGIAENIEKHVNEPGLWQIIKKTIGKYLFFTTNIREALDDVDAVFFCLPTPPNLDGSTDLSIYRSAVDDVCEALKTIERKRRILLINKSTVPIGTARALQRQVKEHGIENFGVASNPEFLPEGEAVEASRKPNRVVVGCDEEQDFRIMRRIYSQFVSHVRTAYIETTPETAEAIKYVANTLLMTYISFWNGVGARLAETFPNIIMEHLRKGVTSDARISTWGSYVSNGAGGSCFGKDIRSLIYQLKMKAANTDLLEAAHEINEYQKVYLVERAVTEAKFHFNNKKVALLGLAFKRRTNDMRESSALKVVDALLGKGVSEIRAYDPLANEEAKKYFRVEKNYLYKNVTYWPSAKEAMQGTDALFITTDWEEFRGISSTIERTVKPPYLIIDGRRMIPDYRELNEMGYTYLAVGSPVLPGKPFEE